MLQSFGFSFTMPSLQVEGKLSLVKSHDLKVNKGPSHGKRKDVPGLIH